MSNNPQYTVIDGIKCFHPEVASAYADYPDSGFDLTDKNAKSSFWVSSRNRLFKNIVKRHLRPTGATNFLEIGCGTGDFIRNLNEIESLKITGSEIYLKGLIYAKKNIPKVDFIQFDVTKGALPEKFDMIVAFDVIEHVDDDIAAIENMRQMLSNKGVLIISVPQHMFLWSRLDEIVKHKRRYSRLELLSKLEGSGFTIKNSTSFLFFLFPLMLISRILDRSHYRLQSDDVEMEKRVKFSSGLNFLFDLFMRVDEFLINIGISLPFGGTLLVMAENN